MKQYIDKAAVLIEALPYIQRFKGKKVIIKYGGSVISQDIYCESVLRDVVFMRTCGMYPIIVHGGGKTISQEVEKAGIEPRFINGLRYTDEATMKIVENVLRKQISKHIADILVKFGAKPILLNGLDGHIIRCKKKTHHLGQRVDLGLVGDITYVNANKITEACEKGFVPVIAPIALDSKGQPYNINADIMAGEVSAAINADKMVYLSDIPGILKDIKDPSSLISSLKKSEVENLIKNGTISGGMIPKIESCLKSMEAGSTKTHIIDGRLQHSLLLEIFTDKGIGTEIVPD